MSDERKAAWDKSVVKVLGDTIKGGHVRCPLWMRASIDRLYTAVPAMVPYQPLCLMGVDWKFEVMQPAHRVTVALMMEKGWGTEQSILMYKNFRISHPKFRFDPEMFRLFSRDQLKEELGPTYGNIVADLCVDSESQPVFSALLFGSMDVPVQRSFVGHQMDFTVDEQTAKEINEVGRLDESMLLIPNGCTSADILRDGHNYDSQKAQHRYHQYTGGYLETGININPRTFDYDLAAIRAEVRQAGCPVEPDRQEPE